MSATSSQIDTTMRHPAKPSSLKRPASTVKPTRRQLPKIDGSKLEGSTTSLAERKRRQPTCSIASLRDLEDEVILEDDFVGYFGRTSENHWTWGKTKNEPIKASRKRRAIGLKKQSDGFAGFFTRAELDLLEKQIPNSPDRSILLRFPLEIRERIYGNLLLYTKPIIVKYDLGTVEHNNLRNHPILRVCKQIASEASSFLYRENIFRAVLREPRITYHLHESFIINQKYLSLFRNVIIEGGKECYHMDWYERASEAVEKLVEAKTVLNTLTFIVAPQRVGKTDTAVGLEAHPVTFADFFYFPGRLMKAFRKVSCKQLNIIVKKFYSIPAPDSPEPTTSTLSSESPDPDIAETTGTIITKRFLISLDLKYMARGPIEEEGLRNAETVKMLRSNAFAVRKSLLKLKDRFEAIFEDDERAVAEGKCRRVKESEKIANISSSGASE